jgi:hypothetical protein
MLKKMFVFCLVFFVSQFATANEQKVGDVTIHYNAFNSSAISAEVASQYGIRRSGQTGIVNISVIKNGKPVVANIFGNARNLIGQLKSLAFKEIKEDKAVYYIATFTFRSDEKITFELQVQPDKQGILMPLQFKQALFVD